MFTASRPGEWTEIDSTPLDVRVVRPSAEHRGKDAEQTAVWSMAEVEDPAAILHHPRGWARHEQERLAAAANQPVARIARL